VITTMLPADPADESGAGEADGPPLSSGGWDDMDSLLTTPSLVAAKLNEGPLWGITQVRGRHLSGGLASALAMTIAPPLDAQPEGYPFERVRIVAVADHSVHVYPLGPARRWLHRNTVDPRSLCLQHPDDDPALLWLWSDGLGRLITRIRLHLLCEETWRRTGQWPGVDLPHGNPADGRLEPVTDPLLRKAMKRWAR
jgi:hypothetical protein